MTQPQRSRRFGHDLVVPVVATLTGLAMVLGGWALQGAEYLPTMLLQLGSSLVLVVPLLLLGRLLEGRMRRTEKRTELISSSLADVHAQMRQTAAELDALGRVTLKTVVDRHERRRLLLEEAARDPTHEHVRLLLTDAAHIRAIDIGGVRVRAHEGALWLRFCSGANAQEVAVIAEARDGTTRTEVAWREDETLGVLAAALARHLRRDEALTGHLPAAEILRLRQLVATIGTAMASRTGERALDIGPVIEIPNEQWAISVRGLCCMQRYYYISAEQIRDSHQDWHRYMATKPWVNQLYFNDAFQTATLLLRHPRYVTPETNPNRP